MKKVNLSPVATMGWGASVAERLQFAVKPDDTTDQMREAVSQVARGSGRTTKQLLDAKPGSLFFWCSDDLGYVQKLAAKHGRADIRICRLSELKRKRHDHLRGLHFSEIIIDHYVEMDDSLRAGLLDLLPQVRP